MSNRKYLSLVLMIVPVLQALPLPNYLVERFRGPVVKVRTIEGVREHVAGGKLHLRLKDFITLVLNNNTDVQMMRLDVMAAESPILSARAAFDPSLNLQFQTQRNQQPQYNQINGAETLNTLSQFGQAAYEQTLATGQTVSLGFNGGKNSSNSAFVFFNPSISTGLTFEITQPLLGNRTNLQRRAPLHIARTQLLITSERNEASIADLVAGAARQYWDAVQLRDNIRVQQFNVELAQKSYDRDKLGMDLGAISSLEIYQSQSQVAQRKLAVIQAQYGYKDALDVLRRLVGADLDPSTRSMEIVLDDDPGALPATAQARPVEEALAQALQSRPELSAVRRSLGLADLNARVARDQMTPRLDLGVQFGANGLGGNQIPASGPLGIGGNQLIPGGMGDALRQTFGFQTPYYGFSLRLSLPVKSSAAQASLTDALVTRARDQYQQRQLEQQVIQEVKQATNQLEMAQAQIVAARTARDLAQKNVDAQQQKYELGGITAFELLDAQSRLANVESVLVSSYAAYQKALISYKRATWSLLEGFDIIARPKKAS